MSKLEFEQVLPRLVDRVRCFVDAQRLPGLAVGLVANGELAWSQGFGLADRAEEKEINQHTLFRVASITKTFTATSILQLRDAGGLSLDDPLQQHIPEFAEAQSKGGRVEAVTLRRMLSHHAGLTTEAPLPCWDALEFPTRGQLLDSISRMEVVIPPDSAFKYSNLAFGLLGEVVARVSGRPYRDYVQSEILQPLALESTTFELSNEQRPRLATGYSPSINGATWDPAPHIALNGLAACGGLYSSPHDLARWIDHQFCSEAGGSDSQILAGTTIAESHRPQYLEADWSIAYCLGWRANRFGDRVYHGHGGGIFGFASQILFSQPHRLGIICLANVWPYSGLLALGGELLDLIVTGATPAEPSQPDTADAEAADGTEEVPAEFQELLGTYTAGQNIVLAVEYHQGSLRLARVPDYDYWLHVPAKLAPANAPHEFIVRGGRGAGETIAFESCADEDSRQFELGGFVYRRFLGGQTRVL